MLSLLRGVDHERHKKMLLAKVSMYEMAAEVMWVIQNNELVK